MIRAGRLFGAGRLVGFGRLAGLAAALTLASVGLAEAPGQSLRPEPRPSGSGASASAAVPAATLRPQTRPQSAASAPSSAAATAAVTATGTAAVAEATKPAKKTKPKARKNGLFAKRKLRKTSICGDIDLQGEAIGNHPGPGACGVKNAVRLRSVSGVALSTPAILNCETAEALKTWVDKGLQPAFKRRGPVVELKVAAHYACRTRNSQKGAKLSEHAKGNAIDISGFKMKDGKVYTVQESWWRGNGKKALRKAYGKACGPFGTTLGPAADRFHQDHFHFDVARYRSGPYCK